MKFPRRRLVYIGIAILSGAILLPAIVLSTWYFVLLFRGRAELAKEVKFVRDRGLPLSTLELNDYYRSDPTKTDVTTEFERLAPIVGVEEFEQVRTLRLVGNGEAPPPTGEPWEQLPEVEAFLRRYQELLQFLETLPDKDATTRFTCDLSPVLDGELPIMGQLSFCGRLLSLQCRVDLYHGRSHAAVDRIVEQLALADMSDNVPDMVIQLTRVIIVGMALKDLERANAHLDLADDELIRLQSSLARFDARASLSLTMAADRAFGYSMCAMPVDALGDYQHELSREEVARRVANGPARPWDAAKLMSFHRRMGIACESSIYAALREGDNLVHDVRELLNSRRRIQYSYTLVIAPQMTLPCTAFAKAEARCQSAIAALAAMRFRRSTGNWPRNLDELVPKYIEKVPEDCYTGKPLRSSIDGDVFKVYGLGENRKDDGGTWDEEERLDEGFAVTWREMK